MSPRYGFEASPTLAFARNPLAAEYAGSSVVVLTKLQETHMNPTKVVLPLITLLTFLLFARSIYGCSCGGSTSVCGSFASAQAVFVGSVTNVENQMAKAEDGREFVVGQVARVQVEEPFKGMKQSEVVFRSYGTSCDPEYKTGQRWLFYAIYNKEDEAWNIRACDRSSLIEGAADDLHYLRALPESRTKTRIGGKLIDASNKPMMGIKVKISNGSSTKEVFTDKDGVYEVYGLAPGKYKIRPEVSPNITVRFSMSSSGDDFTSRDAIGVTLKEKSCAGVSYYFSEKTIITGRVFGVDGRALQDVCVRLLLRDTPEATGFLLDCTDKEGRFKIDEIPLGEYFLVANDDGRISGKEPFPTVYYPGVLEKQKATLLTFASGDKLEDFDIHIASEKATRVIEGVLLFSDGKPVEGEFVEFQNDVEQEGVDKEVHTSTDAQGRFSLPVLQGLKGTLRGFMYTYVGEFENCPKLDQLLKSQGDYVPDVGTQEIKTEVTSDLREVKLVFPFPYCVKAKRPD